MDQYKEKHGPVPTHVLASILPVSYSFTEAYSLAFKTNLADELSPKISMIELWAKSWVKDEMQNELPDVLQLYSEGVSQLEPTKGEVKKIAVGGTLAKPNPSKGREAIAEIGKKLKNFGAEPHKGLGGARLFCLELLTYTDRHHIIETLIKVPNYKDEDRRMAKCVDATILKNMKPFLSFNIANQLVTNDTLFSQIHTLALIWESSMGIADDIKGTLGRGEKERVASVRLVQETMAPDEYERAGAQIWTSWRRVRKLESAFVSVNGKADYKTLVSQTRHLALLKFLALSSQHHEMARVAVNVNAFLVNNSLPAVDFTDFTHPCCSVCGGITESEDNQILECSGGNPAAKHGAHYQCLKLSSDASSVTSWFCDKHQPKTNQSKNSTVLPQIFDGAAAYFYLQLLTSTCEQVQLTNYY